MSGRTGETRSGGAPRARRPRSSGRGSILAAVAAALVCAACGAGDPADGEREGLARQGEPPPERFAFGRPASSEEIAALDIDVGPDGAGLPPGSGSVAEGAEVYAARCAVCHGATGREGPEDVLVGAEPADFPFGDDRSAGPRTIGNYWPYATTIFDYIRRAMPLYQPGSLTDREVYAVTAWLLAQNGIIPDDAVMDATTLPRVRMPARDRFVPDDREATTSVR